MTKYSPIITTVVALVVLAAYLNFALGGFSFPILPSLILALSIGFAAIYGAMEIHKDLL